MWIDRLTGDVLRVLPDIVESGRYLDKIGSPGQRVKTGTDSILVDRGSRICVVKDSHIEFELPPKDMAQKVALFERIIETIDIRSDYSSKLISPLMPEGIVNEDCHLNSFEEKLIEVISVGHLHQISKRPRLDLYYEDEVTDVARAKRLAKGALVHLASHSECWQRQTLSGVIPKRVKARFSEDDYNTYENRVYARLLDKTEHYLSWRVGTLYQLNMTVSEALEFYKETNRHHRLSQEICRLWGQTFSQESTSQVSEQLSETLKRLEKLLEVVKALKQQGLYVLVSRTEQVAGGLHMTNILSHDQHYRHLPILWKKLKGVVGGKLITPEERQLRNEALNMAYSRYTGLVLHHALLPYMKQQFIAEWAGAHLELRQDGFDWSLALTSPDKKEMRVLLKVIPWLGLVSRPEEIKPKAPFTLIAWPNLNEDLENSDEAPTDGCWVPLSPFDLYVVERLGRVIDQILHRELVSDYGQPLQKIPTKSLEHINGLEGLAISEQYHEIRILEELQPETLSKVKEALLNENAAQQAKQLEHLNHKINQLQICPVCSSKTKLVPQQSNGFRISCDSCKTKTYFQRLPKAMEYMQELEGFVDFKKVGRRGFVVNI